MEGIPCTTSTVSQRPSFYIRQVLSLLMTSFLRQGFFCLNSWYFAETLNDSLRIRAVVIMSHFGCWGRFPGEE